MPDNQDLNEQVEEIVDESTVITVPIDDTLSKSNEAADAKAVGDALALKADKSQISTISVNGQPADAQGVIIVTAEDTKLSDTDTTTVKSAIDTVSARTAEDIPMETGSQEMIADAITAISSSVATRTAEQIAMSATDPTTIAAAMANKLGVDAIDATLATEGKAADAKAAGDAIADLDSRMETQLAGVVRRVNSETPDESGNVTINQVPLAGNLMSDAVQTNEAEYVARSSGGEMSIPDGDAWLMRISGRRIHTGVVEEVTEMVVNSERPEPEEGEDPETPITATIDWDVFRAYVETSGTYTLTYNSAWSADPELYGITITGTPESGDQIVITYVKGDRGTITQSQPSEFRSTGWNLYQHGTNLGYARVVKYSDTQGFKVDGAYTSLKFATTTTGTQSDITPVDGAFSVPSDGYVFVNGGSEASTAIWMTRSDWSETYDGDFEPYTVDVISLSSVMGAYFPYGLLYSSGVADEIDLNTGAAINRVERIAYSESAIESLNNQGRAWEADREWIYAVLLEPAVHTITLDGGYTACDHGMEIVEGGNVAPLTATMYGNNLKNKLERDVVTISQQALEASQQRQVRANISAARAVMVDMGTVTSLPLTMAATGVTEKMVCVQAVLGTPSAQTGDWTVTTAADSVTISGTVASSGTTVKLLLVERDEVTATTPAN